MSEQRDFVAWHRDYDDPGSAISWRLRQVQAQLHRAIDERPGPVRILSLCAGDGRDVIGVLQQRRDAARVAATLVELQPDLAAGGRAAAAAAGLNRVEVVTGDAGTTSTLADLVPADVVVLVGIFGNIIDFDIHRTVMATPQLCRTGATVVWSRGRGLTDINATIRGWFAAAGFTEIDYVENPDGPTALGAMRLTGAPQPLVPDRRLFSFVR